MLPLPTPRSSKETISAPPPLTLPVALWNFAGHRRRGVVEDHSSDEGGQCRQDHTNWTYRQGDLLCTVTPRWLARWVGRSPRRPGHAKGVSTPGKVPLTARRALRPAVSDPNCPRPPAGPRRSPTASSRRRAGSSPDHGATRVLRHIEDTEPRRTVPRNRPKSHETIDFAQADRLSTSTRPRVVAKTSVAARRPPLGGWRPRRYAGDVGIGTSHRGRWSVKIAHLRD
jgi:hypothetical protein